MAANMNFPESYAVWDGLFEDVDRPVAEAAGLGNEAYTSDAFFRHERDHLFAKTWTCVGLASDIPSPGDLMPNDTLGSPLLNVRDGTGEVRVFHNVCSHRGVRLVTEPGKVKKVMHCPYHAWSYRLDGHLHATPHIGGQGKHTCEGFDKSKHGLKSIRSAVWMDMIFVNLSGDAPAFEEHVAPLAARWKGLDFTQLRWGGPDSTWSLDLNSNWKLIVENHNDAYHLPWVHPGLNSYSQFEDHYEIVGDDFYAGQGSREYRQRRPADAPALPVFDDLPQHWERRAEYITLFPNAIAGVHADHVWAVWLEPLSCNHTRERMNLYYVGEAPLGDDYASMRSAVCKEWKTIWMEDQDIVEQMQTGRISRGFDGGTFSPALDTPTHLLHRWVARRLGSQRAGHQRSYV